jgi:hypothetical protein
VTGIFSYPSQHIGLIMTNDRSRSDEAYERAASGAGNAEGFQVVDTAADGITQIRAD